MKKYWHLEWLWRLTLVLCVLAVGISVVFSIREFNRKSIARNFTDAHNMRDSWRYSEKCWADFNNLYLQLYSYRGGLLKLKNEGKTRNFTAEEVNLVYHFRTCSYPGHDLFARTGVIKTVDEVKKEKEKLEKSGANLQQINRDFGWANASPAIIVNDVMSDFLSDSSKIVARADEFVCAYRRDVEGRLRNWHYAKDDAWKSFRVWLSYWILVMCSSLLGIGIITKTIDWIIQGAAKKTA
ncbi:MAG: hypothetical protein V1809_12120 [Planctomycetota bacterium]